MELLQLKVAENSYNIIPWKVREQKCFHRMFCSRKKKIILSATSDVVLSALFVVNLEGIDGGGGSTRCYTC